MGALEEKLARVYHLDDFINKKCVICSSAPTGKDRERKAEYTKQDDSMIPNQEHLSLGEYTLMVVYKGRKVGRLGDMREVDVSCHSTFMKDIMPKVSGAICEAYQWVPRNTPISLYLDNVGGHCIKTVVDVYVKALRDNWNAICTHQYTCSPATNMLDLGDWMALQNVVEKIHYHAECCLQKLPQYYIKLKKRQT